ncbi:MAG: ABC-2 family transporter protein [Phycisphaerae bacterium]|nr:ABC-2 family transporter protein [Phycisphaerae bacterium]
MIRPYLAVFSARFRLLLQYRAAAAAGMACQFFWGLIRMMIFQAFYENAVGSEPISLNQTVSYVWLSQGFIMLLPFRVDGEIAGKITSGNVAYELLRPTNLYNLWFAREMANRITPVLLRATPMFILATLAGWLRWPGPGNLAAVAISLLAAVLLSSSISLLMTISMFWTTSGRGITLIISPLMFLLSGMVIPIPLFPDFLQPVFRALPFIGLIDLPIRLFVGHLSVSSAVGVLVYQLLWTAVLILAGKLLLQRGLRRLVVQGG